MRKLPDTSKYPLSVILDTARNDSRIRAVLLNGSRANPNCPADPFQDFDIVYFVREPAFFKNNLNWINRFGELMIMQMPEPGFNTPELDMNSFVYLMQFKNGFRIDLTVIPVHHLDLVRWDSLSVVLLDKDRLLPALQPPNESDYYPNPPTAEQYFHCCNEFWWLCPSIAKGLWRSEILYVKHFLDHFLRKQLEKMLIWKVGIQTEFEVNPGKCGKYLDKYLTADEWNLLLETWSSAVVPAVWDALFAQISLFRSSALSVADEFGYSYPDAEDRRVTAHLRHVRGLPSDAGRIYPNEGR